MGRILFETLYLHDIYCIDNLDVVLGDVDGLLEENLLGAVPQARTQLKANHKGVLCIFFSQNSYRLCFSDTSIFEKTHVKFS